MSRQSVKTIQTKHNSSYHTKSITVHSNSFDCCGGLQFDANTDPKDALIRILKYINARNKQQHNLLDLDAILLKHTQMLIKHQANPQSSNTDIETFTIRELLTFCNIQFCWQCGLTNTDLRCIECGAWTHERCMNNDKIMTNANKKTFLCDICSVSSEEDES